MVNESRICKILITKSGGSASKNAKIYRIALPTRWIKQMGISPEDRTVKLSFNGSEITIRKAEQGEEKKEEEEKEKRGVAPGASET